MLVAREGRRELPELRQQAAEADVLALVRGRLRRRWIELRQLFQRRFRLKDIGGGPVAPLWIYYPGRVFLMSGETKALNGKVRVTVFGSWDVASCRGAG